MSLLFVCDRCGSTAPTILGTHSPNGWERVCRTVDLCEVCTLSLRRFLNALVQPELFDVKPVHPVESGPPIELANPETSTEERVRQRAASRRKKLQGQDAILPDKRPQPKPEAQP